MTERKTLSLIWVDIITAVLAFLYAFVLVTLIFE